MIDITTAYVLKTWGLFMLVLFPVSELLVLVIDWACQSCAGIKACAAKGISWTYCYGRLYTQKSCSPQMIAEADCNGDIDKCGGVCHG